MKTAIYLWTDGRAVYVGQTKYPRERRGQHRSAAKKGGRSAFHKYLREHGVDSGDWHTQWVDSEQADAMQAELIRQTLDAGAISLNGSDAPAGDIEDWRKELESCRKQTAYLEKYINLVLN